MFGTMDSPFNCPMLAGLSLYFEDGHDDLDDCEYFGYFNLLTTTLNKTWSDGLISCIWNIVSPPPFSREVYGSVIFLGNPIDPCEI